MWYLILTLTIIITYLLEAIVPLPLLLIVIISLSSFENPKVSSTFSFTSGILSDIGMARPLGMTSLLFLLVSFVSHLYRRRFREGSFTFLFIQAFIFSNLYLAIFKKGSFLFIKEGLISSILTLFVSLILFSLKPKES